MGFDTFIILSAFSSRMFNCKHKVIMRQRLVMPALVLRDYVIEITCVQCSAEILISIHVFRLRRSCVKGWHVSYVSVPLLVVTYCG